MCVKVRPSIANPRGEHRISHDAPANGMRFNISVSLKEIPGINDRPLLRTDQKHPRTKTVLGGAGQSSMFARETTEKTRMFHLTASPPKQNPAGRCGLIEHARTLETTHKTRMFRLTASPPPRFSTRFRKNRHDRAPRARAIRSQHLLIFT